MTMKILGILGSPCTKGNSSDILEAVLEGARDAGASTERLDIANLEVNPCLECHGCEKTGVCVQENDEMGMVYSMIREVDGIVLASPVFFMGVTAQTKAMIDRCQCFWIERFVLKKRVYEGRRRPKGVFVSCAGGPKAGMFEPSLHMAKAFFSAIDYEYIGEVLLGHTDDPELARRKNEALGKAKELGRRMTQ